MSPTFSIHQGTAPLLVSLPHDGTEIPAALARRMTPAARAVPDTDWHVSRLYAFARSLGASIITPRFSRYVIDLNRPPDDRSLYPGQNTTGLCPLVQFSGMPVYLDGQAPSSDEVADRIERFWQPYHGALAAELTRIRAAHGRVVLWEGHSIRSVVPFLFDGRLPDLNVGTVSGASCAATLQEKLHAALAAQHDYSFVFNGRFKGGYITRHYGAPGDGVDAIQLELAQLNYMDEHSFEYREAAARGVQGLIARLLESCIE